MNSSESIVMLLDDDVQILKAVQRCLRRLWPSALPPLRLVVHREPTVALGDLLTIPVDVILTDYRMPLMDGTEFLRRARALQPDAARVLLSGSPDFDGLLRAVNQGGAIRVVLKPWDDQQLVELIASLVQQRRQSIEEAAQAESWRIANGCADASGPRASGRRLPEREFVDVDARMQGDPLGR